MEEGLAYLAIWLIGLFGLIGIVIAGIVRLVRRDSTEYDRRFLWFIYEDWEQKQKSQE